MERRCECPRMAFRVPTTQEKGDVLSFLCQRAFARVRAGCDVPEVYSLSLRTSRTNTGNNNAYAAARNKVLMVLLLFVKQRWSERSCAFCVSEIDSYSLAGLAPFQPGLFLRPLDVARWA